MCSVSSATVEMKIQRTLRFHLISGKMAIIKKTKTTNVYQDVGARKKHLLTAGENVN
jgi:hypothetical protein